VAAENHAPAAPRKHRRNLAVAGIILIAAVAVYGVTRAGAASHTVTLAAHGGGSMDVTYSVGGSNSQDTAAASPWRVTYTVTGAVPTVAMTVQNGAGGAVSCSITEDGQVVSSNTSHGAYAVVQCSA
jgi:hypothetical protein